MSHLTILPTVLRDLDLMASALEALHLEPQRDEKLIGFAGEQQPVDLLIQLENGQVLGWRQQSDGSLALVADLQKLTQCTALPRLLAEITRTYATHLALREAATCFAGATVNFVC
ncbi:MAG: DUF1257 domain-containing protein [Cyanobium sp.]